MKLFRQVRLSTLLLWMVVMALLFGLYGQERRETQLRAALAFYRQPTTEGIYDALDQRLPLTYPDNAILEDVLKALKVRSTGRPKLPTGIPIYVDPVGLQEVGKIMSSMVARPPHDENLTMGEHLKRVLAPLGLGFSVKDGYLMISSKDSADVLLDADPYLGYRDVLQ